MRATLAFNGLNKQLTFNCFNEFTQYKDIQPMWIVCILFTRKQVGYQKSPRKKGKQNRRYIV